MTHCNNRDVKLLKLGTVVRLSVGRVWLSLSEAYPMRETFACLWEALRGLPMYPVVAIPAVVGTG